MGLDASVRCRCFEDHKLKPGPVPYEDLYVDEEGYLYSRKLREAHARFDYRQFQARYGKLEEEFSEWLDDPCEHEFGEYCSEWVGNWAGARAFEDLVEDAGGEKEFPLLSHLIPSSNGGMFSSELAADALLELDRLIAKVSDIDEWVAESIRSLLTASVETGNPIRWE